MATKYLGQLHIYGFQKKLGYGKILGAKNVGPKDVLVEENCDSKQFRDATQPETTFRLLDTLHPHSKHFQTPSWHP